MSPVYIAYCGLPPLPAEIWQRWLLTPSLLAVLAGGFFLVLRAAQDRWTRRQRCFFIAGWSVLCLALVSPLCALSVALFSMRATQHLVLLMVAVPLLAMARPEMLLGPRWLKAWSRLQGNTLFASCGAAAFAAALWFWHLPSMYDATFSSDSAYWAMHVSLLASALLLWMQLLRGDSGQLLTRTLLAFTSFVQMGVLGALLTFSPTLIYGAHVGSTLAWGLSPLADQQLGGMIMWIPGGSILLLAALGTIARALRGHSAAEGTLPLRV